MSALFDADVEALVLVVAELVYDKAAEWVSELETGAEKDKRDVIDPVNEETGVEVVVIVPTLTVWVAKTLEVIVTVTDTDDVLSNETDLYVEKEGNAEFVVSALLPLDVLLCNTVADILVVTKLDCVVVTEGLVLQIGVSDSVGESDVLGVSVK